MDTIDLTRNTVGAIGNQMSLHATYIHNNGWNGTGNLLSLLSAIGITTRPWISLAGSQWDAQHAFAHVTRELPPVNPELARSPEIVQRDEDQLKRLLSPNSEMQARSESLSVEGHLLDQQTALAEMEQQSFHSGRAEALLRHSMYGPTKMANSTIAVIADYSNIKDRTKTNRWQAAGNLTYTCGQGLNLIEMIRNRVTDEARSYRLQEEGQTHKQLLNSRLEALDDLIAKTRPASVPN
jgi:hypothetical protein